MLVDPILLFDDDSSNSNVGSSDISDYGTSVTGAIRNIGSRVPTRFYIIEDSGTTNANGLLQIPTSRILVGACITTLETVTSGIYTNLYGMFYVKTDKPNTELSYVALVMD